MAAWKLIGRRERDRVGGDHDRVARRRGAGVESGDRLRRRAGSYRALRSKFQSTRSCCLMIGSRGCDRPVRYTAAYLDQHTVLDLQEERLDVVRLEALLKGWQAVGRSVVVVNGPQTSDQVCTHWQCHLLGTAYFDWPTLEASYEHFQPKIDHPAYGLTLLMVDPVP